MSLSALLGMLDKALSGHYDPVADIASYEIARGRVVIRPGTAPWLPSEDWHRDTICSIDGQEARLILLVATRPGAGAFTRTLAGLALAGLRPAVIEPTRELAATLRRRGWGCDVIGRDFETRETSWRPRQ